MKYIKYLLFFVFAFININLYSQIDSTRTVSLIEKDSITGLLCYKYYKYSAITDNYILLADTVFFNTNKNTKLPLRLRLYNDNEIVYTEHYFKDISLKRAQGMINAQTYYQDSMELYLSYNYDSIISKLIFVYGSSNLTIDCGAINVNSLSISHDSIYTEFDCNGNLRYLFNKQNGQFTSFYDNHRLIKNYKRVGVWFYYYNTGELMAKGEHYPQIKWKDNSYSIEKIDSIRMKNPNINIMRLPNNTPIYLKDGVWKYYNKEGEIEMKEIYKDGKLEETIIVK